MEVGRYRYTKYLGVGPGTEIPKGTKYNTSMLLHNLSTKIQSERSEKIIPSPL